MGTRLPQVAALLAALLAVSFGAAAWKAEAAAAPPVVVGSIKCLDCSPNGVNAEDTLQGLQVAIKCRSAADESYETKAVGALDDAGVFRIPLAADLLRDDGSLDGDCFAQLHSAPDTPCVGQAPPRIAPSLSQDGTADTASATYLEAAADTVFSPVACACGKKKKHFMFGPPPPPPPPRPTPNPPTPTPTYGPPTPTPTPVPEPRPPAPEEPEPFFKKKPKMKFMHRKKPCPPLADDDTTPPAAGGQQEKLAKKPN
ncbi:proline-rich protein 4-like [Panicum virgatum]|uniref:Proline-rich protein n=1 Tax=Panicum virgatum TaxID=38727 RepID=A0A8T0NVD5_PANVG|nr:proline-rich protein 4-like [Panicum virgatum]KAG2553420.1 hypothetical protein PVAP13_9KG523400 [Panicum virgatum]